MGIREHLTPDRIANAIRQDKSYQGSYFGWGGTGAFLFSRYVSVSTTDFVSKRIKHFDYP